MAQHPLGADKAGVPSASVAHSSSRARNCLSCLSTRTVATFRGDLLIFFFRIFPNASSPSHRPQCPLRMWGSPLPPPHGKWRQGLGPPWGAGFLVKLQQIALNGPRGPCLSLPSPPGCCGTLDKCLNRSGHSSRNLIPAPQTREAKSRPQDTSWLPPRPARRTVAKRPDGSSGLTGSSSTAPRACGSASCLLPNPPPTPGGFQLLCLAWRISFFFPAGLHGQRRARHGLAHMALRSRAELRRTRRRLRPRSRLILSCSASSPARAGLPSR